MRIAVPLLVSFLAVEATDASRSGMDRVAVPVLPIFGRMDTTLAENPGSV
jgi:hypothetical protein